MTRRVLVVDDDDHVREVAEVSLQLVGGWDVVSVSSGHEGVHAAIAQSPDAILLDLMMPEMDGLATFERLQQHPLTRQIPVVMLTAKVQASDRRDMAGLALAGVLAKPFDPLTLARDVARLLGWPS